MPIGKNIGVYANGALLGVSQAALMGAAITYLLRDLFTTDASAPLASPRTCEPGPGTLTLVQNDGGFATSAGRLVLTAQSTPVFGDLYLVQAAGVARQAGRVMRLNLYLDTTGGLAIFGCNNDATPNGPSAANQYGVYFSNSAALRAWVGAAAPQIGTYAALVDYELAVVLRGAGAFTLIKGGALYPDWSLLWVDNAGTAATIYPSLENYNANGNAGAWLVYDLPAPWTDDYGIATYRNATPSTTQTATGAADTWLEVTWTPASSEVFDLSFRRTDDDNRWILRCDQAAGTIRLYERNAGTNTERTGGTITQTWTAGTAYRVIVRAQGALVRAFVNTGAKNIYSDASFNADATGVAIAGGATVSELISWPITPSTDPA